MIPHEPELENGLLGGLLLNQNEYGPIAEMFHEDLFYEARNRFIARAMIVLRKENKPIDMAAVSQWIKSQGLACDTHHIASLTDKPIFTGFDYRVIQLSQLYIRRSLILKSQKIINSANEPTCDALELLYDDQKEHIEITNRISVGNVSDALDCHLELTEHLDKIGKLRTGEIIGENTGIKELNNLTAGWQKSDLIILAARPGMGKTSLALNFVQAALPSPVLFFSLEMSKMQLYARLASQATSIPLTKFLRSPMDEHERQYFNSNTYKLQNSPLYVDDRGGVSLDYIRNKSRKLKNDKGIKLIIIDHLGFIKKPANNRKSTNDLIGEITSGLKALAKELDIPIICLCQLNRESAKAGDKRPALVDLRDSGNIEQDADMVLFIFRGEYYGITNDGHGNSTVGKAEIIISKHRNGALDTIITGFDAKCTNFYDNAADGARLQPNTDFL